MTNNKKNYRNPDIVFMKVKPSQTGCIVSGGSPCILRESQYPNMNITRLLYKLSMNDRSQDRA